MEVLESKIFFLTNFLPINAGIILPWIITAIWFCLCYYGTRNLSLVPGRLQNFLEILVEGVQAFLKAILGPAHAMNMMPFFTSLFLYMASSNLIGIIPGFKSPSTIFSNCLGMALIIFFLTHFWGFRSKGLGYIKHFWGEPFWMGPLMLPIHIIGELARPVSLTLRLFGNLMGEDVVLLVLTIYIFPLFVPVPMLAFAVFTDTVQALVFTILSTIYVSSAMAPDDHH